MASTRTAEEVHRLYLDAKKAAEKAAGASERHLAALTDLNVDELRKLARLRGLRVPHHARTKGALVDALAAPGTVSVGFKQPA